MYSLLKDMYVKTGTNLCVKWGDCLSSSFRSYVGLRQGDALSPNLFKIYINDLLNYIQVDKDTPYLKEKIVNCLLYADDLVLLSQSEEGLQKSVDWLNRFCEEWKLTVNMDKTKIVVFNKAGKLVQTNVKLNKVKIGDSKVYKYLGIQFTSSGKFGPAKNDLLQRGYKAMYKLTSMFKNVQPNFHTNMHLFDHVVNPVLMYGSEIWGDSLFVKNDNMYNALKNDIIEKCHLKFCRFVIGVGKKAPNLGIYGDSGRYPITVSSAISFVKYWHRISNMNDVTNSLLVSTYEEIKLNLDKYSWFKNVSNMTEFISENVSTCKANLSAVCNKLRESLKTVFIRGWKNELLSDNRKQGYGNKLRTYRAFKSEFKLERYLLECNNVSHRKNFARFRLSAHRLNIESMRYCKPRILPEDRVCTNCNLSVCEDEFHFLMKCDKYKVLRKDLFEKMNATFNYFNTLTDERKFIWLCANKHSFVIEAVTNFLYSSMKIRTST